MRTMHFLSKAFPLANVSFNLTTLQQSPETTASFSSASKSHPRLTKSESQRMGLRELHFNKLLYMPLTKV